MSKSGELKVFKEIWFTRKHFSELSGKPLSFQYWHNQFAHILPKGKYPETRLVKENIILLTQEEHHLLDFGTEKQRNEYARKNNVSWEKIYKKREELKNKYVLR